MKPYSSIETLYVRSKEDNRLDFTSIRNPVWYIINRWVLTEKIDGTNIRVIVTQAGIQVKGRSDNATLPPGLDGVIRELFPFDKVIAHFKEGKPNAVLADDWCVTFYGEGYGAGIKGSQPTNYRDPKNGKFFRCFDVCYGENHWASPAETIKVCSALSVPQAPTIGVLDAIPTTKDDALAMLDAYARLSIVAYNEADTQIPAEGIVARPEYPLYDQWGHRVIWKLTRREFNK